MPEPLFSASWYRVAELRPRLRGHARIHRHVYRGEPWYVLEDVANQRVHRYRPAAHAVIGLMDGERRVHDIWETAAETLGDDAPTQDEMIRLLAQLHAADVLQCDVPPDTAELLERYEKRERRSAPMVDMGRRTGITEVESVMSDCTTSSAASGSRTMPSATR